MADVVRTQTIQDGDAVALLKFTNISDGTGENGVTKVAVEDLEVHSSTKKACTSVAIHRLWYSISGESGDAIGVDILWDATDDELAWNVTGCGYLDFRCCPLSNSFASGATGDIKFTTLGFVDASRYSIIMELRKNYDVFPPES